MNENMYVREREGAWLGRPKCLRQGWKIKAQKTYSCGRIRDLNYVL